MDVHPLVLVAFWFLVVVLHIVFVRKERRPLAGVIGATVFGVGGVYLCVVRCTIWGGSTATGPVLVENQMQLLWLIERTSLVLLLAMALMGTCLALRPVTSNPAAAEQGHPTTNKAVS